LRGLDFRARERPMRMASLGAVAIAVKIAAASLEGMS
jgi:hypothetical protein